MEESSGASAGPATDRHNEPVIDPTENVKALDDAAQERQDALRNLESAHVREILAIRTETAKTIRAADMALTNEKFAGVERIAILNEGHRLELKGDSEKALTAALAASKEAVSEQNKSATLSVDRAVAGMKELIVNNYQISQAETKALGDKVEDLKTTVGVLVNTKIGAGEQKQEQRTVSGDTRLNIGAVFGVISVVLVLVFGVISILLAM